VAEACAKIKAQGFALDEAEFIEEVRCVAAPVRGKDGGIVAAIGISAPVARLSRQRLAGTVRLVAAAAKQISVTPANRNAPGVPAPLPRASAIGRLPTMAASGAAAATTRKMIRCVESTRRFLP